MPFERSDQTAGGSAQPETVPTLIQRNGNGFHLDLRFGRPPRRKWA